MCVYMSVVTMQKYTSNVFLCVLFALYVSGAQDTSLRLQTVNGKIKLSLGTTAGCTDTIALMIGPFAETYEEFKDFMEVEFVPWGRTVRNSDGSLTCQFLEPDCWANRVHRCALDILKGDQDAQVRFMSCEFSLNRPAFTQQSYACAHAEGINLVDLDYCVTTSGEPLDYAAEQIAVPQMEVINQVPSYVFNDNIDRDTHVEAWNRFKSLICIALSQDPTTGVTNCPLE